jgi:Fe-S-cluster containining protein
MRLHAQEAAIGAFILNRVGKRSTPRATTRHRAISSSWLPGSAQEEKPWYIQGKNDNDAAPPLPFDCTGCGKCCKTKGSVLMSPMEVFGASSLLKTTISEFKQQYVALEEQLEPEEAAKNQIGWVQLKNSKETGGCVFLDPETNYCKIYKARPLQCSSYPFWPRIMGSK